jgi:hypothetical protein
LLSCHWSDQQKSILLEAINNPSKQLESQALAAFSPQDARNVFYKIGTADISPTSRRSIGLPFGKGSQDRRLDARTQSKPLAANISHSVSCDTT